MAELSIDVDESVTVLEPFCTIKDRFAIKSRDFDVVSILLEVNMQDIFFGRAVTGLWMPTIFV